MKLRSLEYRVCYCLACLAVVLLISMQISKNANAEQDQQVPLSASEITPCVLGYKVPDIVLKRPDKSEFNLNNTIKQSPIVLIFYRGGW